MQDCFGNGMLWNSTGRTCSMACIRTHIGFCDKMCDAVSGAV